MSTYRVYVVGKHIRTLRDDQKSKLFSLKKAKLIAEVPKYLLGDNDRFNKQTLSRLFKRLVASADKTHEYSKQITHECLRFYQPNRLLHPSYWSDDLMFLLRGSNFVGLFA